MKRLNIDIETYSNTNINNGVYKYSEDPEFKILLFAVAVDGGPVDVYDFKHGDILPPEIYNALMDPSVEKWAFNAQFERVCIDKYFNIKSIGRKCSMIKARSLGIAGGLDGVSRAMGIPSDQVKIKAGRKLIDIYCTPKNVKNILPEPEQRSLFMDYNARDVKVEMFIYDKLLPFKIEPIEWELYTLDQTINDRGIKIDLDMASKAIDVDKQMVTELSHEYESITGKDNPKSIKDIKEFIKSRTNMEVESVAKGVIDDLKSQFKDYPDVVRVLEIRELTSKSSTAKYKKMLETTCDDSRSRGNIQFFGATNTGRRAGRLLQVHNFPRNYLDDLDTARLMIKTGDYDAMSMVYDDVPDILKQCLRTAIIPKDDNKFMVADYSAIEARVIARIAGEDWVIDVFRTTGNIYEATAAKMFNVPIESIGKGSDMRQRGKVATLALGYQGGVGALEAMGALSMGIPEDELPELVSSWRASNPKIVGLWAETDQAVKRAIINRSYEKFANGKCSAHVKSGVLWLTLPSGRRLAYAKPSIEPHKKRHGMDQIVYKERVSPANTWKDVDTYGGKLVENIVQATARDLLAFSLLNLDKAGYKTVMHVHDEVVIEINKNANDLEKICDIMAVVPKWAHDLPLTADGYECEYYKKD